MAKGSQATLDGYTHIPRVCSTCGGKVVISRESLTFETDVVTGVARIWHSSCGRPS